MEPQRLVLVDEFPFVLIMVLTVKNRYFHIISNPSTAIDAEWTRCNSLKDSANSCSRPTSKIV
jgi:hypothetical protein